MTTRKQAYTIGQPEGVQYVLELAEEPPTKAPEVGDTVHLNLEDDVETALLAAGWLIKDTGPKGGDK